MEGFRDRYKQGYTADGREILDSCRGSNQALEDSLETLIIELEADRGVWQG